MPAAAQLQKHFSGLLRYTRLTQDFTIDHDNGICPQDQAGGRLGRNGSGFGLRQSLYVDFCRLPRQSGFIHARAYCVEGPTNSNEYLCTSRAGGGQHKFMLLRLFLVHGFMALSTQKLNVSQRLVAAP
jgi:hypothetical protein